MYYAHKPQYPSTNYQWHAPPRPDCIEHPTKQRQCACLEGWVAVELKHAKVDVVAAQRPRQDGQAEPDALVLAAVRV